MEHATDADFKEKVEESNIPVVIDFWASWCMPCKMFGPIFEEVSKGYEGKVKFVKVSTEEAMQTANKFNIMSIPTVVFLKEGKEVDRVSGMMSKEKLKEAVDKLIL